MSLGEHLLVRRYATLTDRIGRAYRVELDHLLKHPLGVARKADLPLWGAVETNEAGCSRPHIKSVGALVFDLDRTDAPAWDALVERVRSVARVAMWLHSTPSHTEAAPRARLIVPALAPMGPADALAVGSTFAMALDAVGVTVDPAACDYDTRRSYWPGRVDGGPYRWTRLEGAPLDTAGWLDTARQVEQARARQRRAEADRRAALARRTRPRDGSRYVAAALASAAREVAAAPRGARNTTLNREAYSLARLVADGRLDGLALDELAAAARAAGLGEREIARTIASARKARLS